MPIDIAYDFSAGDIVIAPNKDVDRRTGLSLIDQRIRMRLKIFQGSWLYDPTGGTLGSRLSEATRMPIFRAIQEVPLLVREALQPMDDIDVTNVTCEADPLDSSAVELTVFFNLLDESGQTTLEDLSTTVTIAG